ncbi:MAG: aminoacyl-tRNA hydrolase [Gemmatimonadota bacterium]|nr:aminoacyl-tRNA hydrolase [Gemmatimonadota bacterium]
MRTLLALGNPGARYRDTRHNVGWWLADRLCVAWSLPAFRAAGLAAATAGRVGDSSARLVKPLTYVNRSGRVVEKLRSEGLSSPDLLVLVDDVSLPPGTFRLRARGSAGGHNGLLSIEETLGTREYARLRIGVGRPHDPRIDLAEWVLAPMSDAEEEQVLLAFGDMVSAVECWMAEGIETAMNRFNRIAAPVG